MRSEEKALQITNKEICGKNGLGVARGKSRDRKERQLSEERGKNARCGGGGGCQAWGSGRNGMSPRDTEGGRCTWKVNLKLETLK